jgi:uridylate kinase
MDLRNSVEKIPVVLGDGHISRRYKNANNEGGVEQLAERIE